MKLVFATHNENKVKEVQAMLPPHISLLSLTDIGCIEDIPETGKTLEENAILKANYVTQKFSYPCFADDTGLIVNALHTELPVRLLADDALPKRWLRKIIKKLLSGKEGWKNRKAKFTKRLLL